ncbi:MAG: HAD hydrolase-like protein [Candidatus Promineifilaceae bacterium]
MPSSNGHLTNIRAIVFDFDGVILESADIKTVAFLELFNHRPDLQPAILQYHLDNLGVSRYDKFAWIYEELLGRPFTAEVREQLGRDFSALVLQKVLLSPFVPGALETLQTMSPDIHLFVASGTPQEELDLIVEKRGLQPYFKEVCGTPRQKPEIIRGILEDYHLAPHEAVMVGDGSSDHKAAVATNLHFVARTTPEMADYWQQNNIPYIIDDLSSFPELFR